MENLSFKQKARKAFGSFSLVTKIVFFVLLTCFIVSGLTFAYLFNDSFKVDVPETGGTLKEGVIGFPQSVSPLTAENQTDKDISALIFSGLLRQNTDGSFSPDLASSYKVSPDGLTYDFTLRPNSSFQNGTKVTADDVVYTVEQAEMPKVNPELAAMWQGVQVAKVKTDELKFTLPKASNSFLSNFTLGIVPKTHSTGFPVGAGPYKIKNIKNAIDGSPEYYELVAYKDGAFPRPYIDSIIIRFYANEKNLLDGFRNNEIDSTSGVSANTADLLLGSGTHIANLPTDRVFGVFFNEKNLGAASDPSVRQALNIALDRGDLVSDVFQGVGFPLYLPVPSTLLAPSATTSSTIKNWQSINGERLTDARAILHQAGWAEDAEGNMEKAVKGQANQTLSLTLNVPNVPVLVATANYLKSAWANIGVQTSVIVTDNATFSTDVLAGKKYQAVLFGEEVGNPVDLSPFWHTATTSTSTISLNASLWTNKQADALLNDADATTSAAARTSDLRQVEDMIVSDMPAIFLYQPAYPYVMPKSVISTPMTITESPEQRFDNVRSWHIETERVWKMFAR